MVEQQSHCFIAFSTLVWSRISKQILENRCNEKLELPVGHGMAAPPAP